MIPLRSDLEPDTPCLQTKPPGLERLAKRSDPGPELSREMLRRDVREDKMSDLNERTRCFIMFCFSLKSICGLNADFGF